ncbi:MarR family transcriptional regulator [Halopiger djelfimassiliensis]|uniref:MarR family transcriptional regulator n=1 Tax=Halopiger djelfimassiliensis TaxID=1293047 RepID=UPI00067760D5|nr:MarR family transcriptional regulator [Halopiger djelfimassiliensis]
MTGCSDRSLLRVLDERGPARVTVLAGELEAHPITVTQHCDDLQSDGYVRRLSADVYGITEDGREYLATLPE